MKQGIGKGKVVVVDVVRVLWTGCGSGLVRLTSRGHFWSECRHPLQPPSLHFLILPEVLKTKTLPLKYHVSMSAFSQLPSFTLVLKYEAVKNHGTLAVQLKMAVLQGKCGPHQSYNSCICYSQVLLHQ